MAMTSNKPYLIRAIYDWIVDNDLTPYLLINADMPDIDVPGEYVSDGRIVLNISPKACRGLHLENDRILFTARFSGQATQIFLTPQSVLAIYAKENGRGMEFNEEDETNGPAPTTPQIADSTRASKKPALKLVK